LRPAGAKMLARSYLKEQAVCGITYL
jgi:hypothetical protein